MAAPSDQSMHEMASENEPTTNEVASENDSVVDEEVSNTSEAEFENQSVTNEVALENQSTTDVKSTSNGLGLLSLPAELRVLIFGHLLVEQRPLSMYWPGRAYQPFPAILNTCTRIRQEAFRVLFRENIFYVGFLHPRLSSLNYRRINDTIQNIHVDIQLYSISPFGSRSQLIHLVREFGSPAIVRGTLNIILRVRPSRNQLYFWVGLTLPRFTNFRIVRIEYLADSAPHRTDLTETICRQYCAIDEQYFPVYFGPAISFADGCGLEYHPQKYLNSLPEAVDWIDHLDGIRLDWGQDPPTNPDEPGASAQNSSSEA